MASRWRFPLWLKLWLACIATLVLFSLAAVGFIRVWLVPKWQEQRQQMIAERMARGEMVPPFGAPGPFGGPRMRPGPPPEGGTDLRRTLPPPPVGPLAPFAPRRLAPWWEAMWLVVAALALGVGTYPIVRRLTRRIERLQGQLNALGQGDFRARADDSGSDELSELARSFNASASRIEHLVASHKQLLAHTSHELRTPLTRLQLGLAALDTVQDAQAKATLRRHIDADLAELNTMIDEILLASRLDAQQESLRLAAVDVLALVAEEAARTGAHVQGDVLDVQADDTLLRRAVRNLLENAARHAPQSPAEAEVRAVQLPGGPGVRISVTDSGPGVPAAERARVFEPFHRAPGTVARGTGLGLALVARIAQRHGGAARCEARPDGQPGARFVLTLPLHPPAD
jgi:signal transduction histidine kinase